MRQTEASDCQPTNLLLPNCRCHAMHAEPHSIPPREQKDARDIQWGSAGVGEGGAQAGEGERGAQAGGGKVGEGQSH